MTISIIFLMSLVSVASALIVLVRVFGVRRVLKNATWVDIGFTVIVCFALAGTLTGLLIGIVAGLVMTGTLTVWKALLGRYDAAAKFKTVREGARDDWCPGGSSGRL